MNVKLTLASLLLGAAVVTQAQPIGNWYGTMSNFNGPRQARIVGGVMSISAASAQFEAPIAVWGDVRTTGFFSNGSGALYDGSGNMLGPTYTHPSNIGNTFDGTTDGLFNYTVELNTGTVYRTDRDWQNPVPLFGLGTTSQGGITWDASSNTLWVAQGGNAGLLGQYTMAGALVSSTMLSGTGALNDLAMDVDGTLWTHGNALEHFSTTGTHLGSFAMNLNGDTIRGGEIGAVPEPGSMLALASGVAALLARRRRA